MNLIVNKVVVVGGGSAGWMAAATIKSVFPEKEVVVIESPDTPTVGVGESTLGFMNDWLRLIGLPKEKFMAECDAIYKLSIKFRDFYEKGSGSFHYPFTRPIVDSIKGMGETEDWYVKKMLNPETPVEDYTDTFYPVSHLLPENKFANIFKDEDGTVLFDSKVDSALHFDASMFGAWLRENLCLPKGVILKTNTVKDWSLSDSGIDYLLLDNGEKVYSDLFIDCTGFHSILIRKALQEEWIDYSNKIPNNRAWATQIPYADKNKEMEPYTTCTAIENGWVWNIPSWKRIGTGYVYSDKFISPEDALKQFKNYLKTDYVSAYNPDRDVDSMSFKDVKFKVGIYKRTWVKNVVAIGLAAGFIEPLESNGLFTVHKFLEYLCATLERKKVSQWDRDAYNNVTFEQFNLFADFVTLHYALSLRDDTEYWRNATGKNYYPELINSEYTIASTPLDLVARKFYINKWGSRNEYGGPASGLSCVATGLNYPIISATEVYTNQISLGIDVEGRINYLDKIWAENISRWSDLSKELSTVYEHLSNTLYKDKL